LPYNAGHPVQHAGIPLSDDHRVAVVRQLELLDTPAEERFDRITRVAARALGVSAATISFVDERREWVKSAIGFPHPQLARPVSLAAHAVASGELVAVPDVAADVRFYDNPVVLESPRIRAFASQPLQARDGAVVGTLSVYDHAPRDFGAAERELMADLAAICERELRERVPGASALADQVTEVQRIDSVTRLWNRSAMFDIMRRELECAHAEARPVALVMLAIDLDDAVRPGTTVSDAILAEAAHVLRASLRPYDIPARFGGAEFAALLSGVDETKAVEAALRIRRTIQREVRHPAARQIRIAVGVAAAVAREIELERLVRSAQSALWEDRKQQSASLAHSSPVS
jgi:diguanylate cyclase (GGDEF)-like protein